MATANAEGAVTPANLVAGRHRIQFAGIPNTHYVKEIRAGDQIISADEVEIPDASTALTVSLAIGKGELRGLARNEKGDPVAGAHIGLIPEPRRPFRIRAARTDQNGLYLLANVPLGEYNLIALDSIESGALDDEEIVRKLRPKLTKVRVEVSSQSVALIVVPAPER